jgi:hypothetical protein
MDQEKRVPQLLHTTPVYWWMGASVFVTALVVLAMLFRTRVS